jgi:DNA-directed RNA polymerase subunit RPC12/RpoP
MRLIDADVLYERACELEAQALEYVGKIIHDDEKIEEGRKWSAILNERTAFKHGGYDGPTIEERKTGKWIQFPNHMAYKCSECGRVIQTTDGQRNVSKHYPFCHCGADMRGDQNED